MATLQVMFGRAYMRRQTFLPLKIAGVVRREEIIIDGSAVNVGAMIVAADENVDALYKYLIGGGA